MHADSFYYPCIFVFRYLKVKNFIELWNVRQSSKSWYQSYSSTIFTFVKTFRNAMYLIWNNFKNDNTFMRYTNKWVFHKSLYSLFFRLLLFIFHNPPIVKEIIQIKIDAIGRRGWLKNMTSQSVLYWNVVFVWWYLFIFSNAFIHHQ